MNEEFLRDDKEILIRDIKRIMVKYKKDLDILKDYEMQTENLSLNKLLTIFGGACILHDWFIYNDVKYHVVVISTNPRNDFKQIIFNDGKNDFVVNYFNGRHNGFLRKINL